MIIPKELKDFSLWLSPNSLKVFNKWELMKNVKQVLTTQNAPFEMEQFKTLSGGLTNSPDDLATFALRLYFFQIETRTNLSLDLRENNFTWDGHWQFTGKRLAFNFSPNFIQSMRLIYHSYYFDDAQNLAEHLDTIGLMHRTWDERQREDLILLFRQHFKIDENQGNNFTLAKLYESFSKIFRYIKENDGSIPSDFAIFGLYLSSLYMTLGKANRVSAQDSYHFVKNLQIKV